MAQVTLSQDDAKILADVLRSSLSDLRMEVVDTENREYRDELKRREDFLKRFIENVEQVIIET